MGCGTGAALRWRTRWWRRRPCRKAGKFSATPVSGPYSPHSANNNRYSQSRGAKAVIDTWTEHALSLYPFGEPPLPLPPFSIAWYKQPAGILTPVVVPADEAVFYFYNLQPVNNS